jgi:hypothetical protein
MNAVLARLVGTGGDDSTLMGPGADDERLSAPFGMGQEFNRRKKSVHVDMKNRLHSASASLSLLLHFAQNIYPPDSVSLSNRKRHIRQFQA